MLLLGLSAIICAKTSKMFSLSSCIRTHVGKNVARTRWRYLFYASASKRCKHHYAHVKIGSTRDLRDEVEWPFFNSSPTVKVRHGVQDNVNVRKVIARRFHTYNTSRPSPLDGAEDSPGSRAFADAELAAIVDLFYKYAKNVDGGVDDGGSYLCLRGVKELLASIGERPDDMTLRNMFRAADMNDDGKLHLHEFLFAADKVLGGAPARTVLVVGGPGSGKGVLCSRLAAECGAVHLSCGDLLREEVDANTPLGRECADIMLRGDLVSSAVVTALVRRRMRAHPGKRVLLDGFPRSLENALDFAELCGTPELALNLYCDDTILMERILNRAKKNNGGAEGGSGNGLGGARQDDNIETALKRLRTFHKSQRPTLDWLRENHVPVINLDCSGSPESVWEQLLAIGRLMRPAVKIRDKDFPKEVKTAEEESNALPNFPPIYEVGVEER